MRAADPQALELYRSYAASRSEVLWKLRLPTSVPYLFSSLRVAAAASVIGAIVGEIPAGVADSLGSAIVNYNQYYVTAPARLWVTIVMCTFIGLAFVGIVRVAEERLTRGKYRTMDAQ